MQTFVPRPPEGLTAEDRTHRRRAAFLAQDGLVLSCVLSAIREIGVLDPYRVVGCPDLPAAGFGSLRVVLRTLTAQGWLADGPGPDPAGTVLRWTAAGQAVASHHDDYLALSRFLVTFASTAANAWDQPWSPVSQALFGDLLERSRRCWDLADLPDDLRTVVQGHLDGALVLPVLLSGADVRLPAGAEELLQLTGWSGERARRLAATFGMSASYLPMFARLPEMLRGTLSVSPVDGREWHVNRALNVNASGAAHGRYFDDTLGIVLDLFDRPNLAEQPRFIADVGCGNGRWLAELHRAVRDRTLRGAHLDDHPLVMVGIDANRAALDEAARLLAAHQVPAVLLTGDISRPDEIAAELAPHGLRMDQGLHIRSFIDHDRTYLGERRAPGESPAETGAYLDPDGHALAEAALDDDLVAHLRRWAPHVRQHGLVVLEAHSVAPEVARRHIGATHGVAFETYHGLSQQYPVPHSTWLRCCRAAGLEAVPYHGRRYPSTGPAVAVSLSRLVPVAQRAMLVPPVTDDGRALHELLFTDGDLRRPRSWCADPTGWIVAEAVRAIEQRLAVVPRGGTVRVLDYGAGTGLGAIELLKALNERQFDRRLTEAGVAFELRLADLPTEWFAQGRRLLGGHPWVRFDELRGGDGSFRAVPDVMAGATADVIIASMVFHLIPGRALAVVAAGLAAVLRPGGVLLWNSPDIGPPAPNAFLFHDVNRAVRATVLGAPLDDSMPADVRAAVLDVRRRWSPESDGRAQRRILPRPNDVEDLTAVLDMHFTGRIHQADFEIQPAELLDTLLIPSNAAEYLPEIDDRPTREAVIRAMVARVVPELRATAGGTGTGLNIRWTFGRHDGVPA